jgi:ATP synthase F1 delta subunit
MEALAEVYARSLFEVAEEHQKIGEFQAELGEFTDVLAGDRDLQVFFFSPYFSSAEKIEGLHKAVSGMNPNLVNFLELLIEKHRMPAVMRIRVLFDRMSANHEGLLPVQITSAVPLDTATTDSLGKRIGEQTGQKVSLNAVVDPTIIGGLILRVGNQILDASIHTRLERLRRQVATGA